MNKLKAPPKRFTKRSDLLILNCFNILSTVRLAEYLGFSPQAIVARANELQGHNNRKH